MRRFLLKSKIHRATVIDADVNYDGSITLDQDLMDAADLVEHEQVDVYDVTNGARLTTYAIAGPRGTGTVCINGAAARLVRPGDLVIIVSYGEYSNEEAAEHQPSIVLVDDRNRQRMAIAPTA